MAEGAPLTLTEFCKMLSDTMNCVTKLRERVSTLEKQSGELVARLAVIEHAQSIEARLAALEQQSR